MATPISLATELCDKVALHLQCNMRILDPACGSGSFLYNFASLSDNKNLELNLTGIEIDAKRAYITRGLLSQFKCKIIILLGDFFVLQDFGMKFDIIIGNPPFNKGIVKPEYMIHSHEAMNSEREGYIGFFVIAQQNLMNDGLICFITPGKFMMGPGAKKFRTWLIKSFNNIDICVIRNDIFKGIGVDKLVITTVFNNQQSKQNTTTVKHLNGECVIMDITRNIDYIIPDFGSQQIYNIYQKLASTPSIPFMDTEHTGEYGADSKKHFSEIPNDKFKTRVARSVKRNGAVEYNYTDLKSSKASKQWRLITKMSFSQIYGIIAPGEEHDYSMWGCTCKSQEEAETMLLWTKTKLFKILWQAFHSTRHTHVIIRYIARPALSAYSDIQLYRNFGLDTDDITAIEGFSL